MAGGRSNVSASTVLRGKEFVKKGTGIGGG